MAVHVGRAASTRLNRLSQYLGHLERSIMTSSSTTTVATAPWREAFVADMESMKPPNFTLSSVYQASPSSFLPRARTVVYRGMWASLVPNSKNPAVLNPAAYQTDLPTITTDARMHKVPELFSTSLPAGPSSSSSSSSSDPSARGGPVEAVFWADESKTQWRLRGHVYMIGPDIDSDHAAPVRESLMPYMRRIRADDHTQEPWSWSRELTAHFGNVSPSMRGTFRNPPPGTPRAREPDQQGLRLGQKVQDVHDDIARQNFRVLVIVPDEVDRVDLADAEGGRRWNYTLERGSWRETELWP
ncbi:hypothetical protein E4U42_001080 [Claviceps africana]|uniref:Pyridoxamine 5'-phosphate oxidase Alr4036 family FMN-binding domain-containing protein n=1 Tax=Claviceps africana TaxID=83212 RepID=A0A8K0J1Y8_9HYPO|nr:hypothetical protein E4U42_001080 [Claviceps africana]